MRLRQRPCGEGKRTVTGKRNERKRRGRRNSNSGRVNFCNRKSVSSLRVALSEDLRLSVCAARARKQASNVRVPVTSAQLPSSSRSVRLQLASRLLLINFALCLAFVVAAKFSACLCP